MRLVSTESEMRLVSLENERLVSTENERLVWTAFYIESYLDFSGEIFLRRIRIILDWS